MNLFSRHTDYAIRALIYMSSRESQLVSTADLDRDMKLPRPFMRRTLQILQRAGYLSSMKGNRGGFRMAKSPAQIRLIDLIRIFQGEISLSDCLLRKQLCHSRGTCPLRREVQAMEQMLVARLRALTIADLIGSSRKGRG